jgi:hypothetical protein
MFSYDFNTLAIQSSIYISFIFISLVREAQEVKFGSGSGVHLQPDPNKIIFIMSETPSDLVMHQIKPLLGHSRQARDNAEHVIQKNSTIDTS